MTLVPLRRRAHRLAAALIAAACVAAALGSLGAREKLVLPPIVFAQRLRLPGAAVALGVGPAGRAVVAGGRLVVRERDGRFVPLLPEGRFFDVQHPSVSYDGRWIAFAAVTARDSAWRIWKCTASGRELAPVTLDARAGEPAEIYGPEPARRFARFDDLAPCWLPDGRLVFASTRYPLLSQAGPPATNLWVVNADGTNARRITAERDGGEAPSVDPVSGRLLYARWFFNRFRAADNAAGLVAGFAGSLPADTVNLWQPGSIEFDGDHLRLAGGDPRTRMGEMGYQPLVLADTTFVGVVAERGDLVRPSRLGVWAYPKRFGPARPLAGFGSPTGWSACAPAALPDGRVLFSLDDAGTGNFDLYVCGADGRGLMQVTGDLQSLEVDAAVLAPRPLPPPPVYGEGWTGAPDPLPRTTLAAIRADERTARFDCLNVFANAPVDAPFPGAVPIARGVRIRFFTALPRPLAEGNDSLVLVQEAELTPQGAVHVDAVPADQPMFEQLVGADGRVLRSAHGPAHVPGYNFTRPGAGTKCVGCHAGHSAIAVPMTAGAAEWTNVAPGARATASSEQRGTPGAAAAVDRRTRGVPDQVCWIADGDEGEWLRLEFPVPIEAREVVLYGMRGRTKEGGPLVVKRAELVLYSGGRETGRVPVPRELSPDGTRVPLGGARMDALLFRPLAIGGKFRGRALAALAEIETIARIAGE
ncbi:MAG: hypothetical protein IT347_06865 [Candidatus Eisenbacteria bacterium]|nr:hypothetical protein [Candidatus Eisenbacteria bacterium]